MNLSEPVWLNPDHPNYETWMQGRQNARKRAQIVLSLVSADVICKSLQVLDLGSGEGGTAALFSEENNVYSFDISLLRLKRQNESEAKYPLINGSGESLPFKNSSFDLIILQDVIEHSGKTDLIVTELARVLKDYGIIYLSTPNKFSVFNIISDPHWGIPFLSLCKRDTIKKYFLKFFRKEDEQRFDIAELLSLKDIKKLFSAFNDQLKTKEIVEILSVNPSGILWSDFHNSLYSFIKKSGLISLLKFIASDRASLVNKFFTPTFYFVFKKKQTAARLRKSGKQL